MPVNTLPKYRADIDGLRGIAVLLVLGFHAFPAHFPGGFIGVDVFFVVSGYLISSIIFASLDRGAFSFVEFYTRRIRRILPALIVVLAATAALGWFALLADEYKSLGKHIAAGALFVSNLLLWRESGYFDTAAELKPLLHLWSLGVEEQFYLMWPLILWISWKRRWNLRRITLLVLIVSFALNVIFVKTKPVATFYLPFTRLWELIAGALLAHYDLHDRPRSASRLQTETLSIAGLAIVVVAAFALDRHSSFPGYRALLPVVGTSLLIGHQQTHCWVNRRLLAFTGLVWIGLISYPLYLWHWPLLSISRIVESQQLPPAIAGVELILAIVLAWLTYRLIERPIRIWDNREFLLLGLPPMLLLIGTAGYAVNAEDGIPSRFPYPNDQFKEVLFPNVDECKERYPFARNSYCGLSSLTEVPSVVVIGDSHSRADFPALTAYYSNQRKALVAFGLGGCPPLIGVLRKFEDAMLDCNSVASNALDFMANHPRIDTVVLAANWSQYPDLLRSSGASGQESGRELFDLALDATIRRIEAERRRVVLLHQVPVLNFDPKICRPRPFRLTSRNVCQVLREASDQKFALYKALMTDVLRRHPDVIQVDPMRVMCDSNVCFAERRGKVLYFDNNHINLFGAEFLGSGFESAVMPHGQ